MDSHSVSDITGTKLPDVLKEQNMLQAVLGAMDYGLSVQDPDFTVIYQNDYSINIVGNHIGEKCYRAFENNDTVCDGCPVELAFKDGQSHTSIRKIVLPSGEVVFFENTANPIRDASGKIVSCLETARDINDRKQIEERLRESEQQLSLIYYSIGDALYSLAVEPDDCFRFLSINRTFLDVTGLTEDQIVGKRIEEVIPEPSVWTVRNKYKKAIEKKRIFRWEETSEYPAGVKVGEVSIAPVFNDNGICIFLVGAVHDITDRKRAEEDLRKSEERFRKFTEISPVGIFITDRDGKTVYWNEQLCKITSMSPEDGMGTGWADGIHPEDRERVSKEWYGSAEARSTFKSEYRFVDRSGKVTHAIGQAVALHDSENEITGYVGTITDITARRQLENEVLKISAREQRRIGLELHDGLGQQLTGVSFMMKALEQKLANAGVPEYADVTRLSEYLRDMVRLTRDISQGLCPVGIDDRGLMTGLEKLADHVIDTYGISCRFTCGGNIKLKDTDVATHLYRIAQEAVTNAVKHGQAHTIEIRLTETDDRISLKIKDDGVGFSPQTENLDGLGVKIMRYRANVIGATFSIMSGKPAGTVIECQIAVTA